MNSENHIYANKITVTANSSDVFLSFFTMAPVLNEKTGDIIGEKAIGEQHVMMSMAVFAGLVESSQLQLKQGMANVEKK